MLKDSIIQNGMTKKAITGMVIIERVIIQQDMTSMDTIKKDLK